MTATAARKGRQEMESQGATVRVMCQVRGWSKLHSFPTGTEAMHYLDRMLQLYGSEFNFWFRP